MYSSNEVSKYLGVQHKVLLVWCDDYYKEFGKDDDYDTSIELHHYNTGTRYYMIGDDEVSGFGCQLKGKKGKDFLYQIKQGNLYSDIDDFLSVDTKLKQAIRATITVPRMREGLTNDGKYYYHYTSLIYSVLGIDLPKGTNPRDVLDKRMLVRLEDMEDSVADMITSCDMHYKECYIIIKNKLTKELK